MRYLAQRPFVVVACGIALATLGLIVTARHSRAQAQAGAPTSGATITPSVPLTRDEYVDFVGRTEAVQTIEVRHPVPALLTKIAFREGQEVQQGDLLFEFDPRSHQAALDLARAELARAEAGSRLGTLTGRNRSFGGIPGKEIEANTKLQPYRLVNVRQACPSVSCVPSHSVPGIIGASGR